MQIQRYTCTIKLCQFQTRTAVKLWLPTASAYIIYVVHTTSIINVNKNIYYNNTLTLNNSYVNKTFHKVEF